MDKPRYGRQYDVFRNVVRKKLCWRFDGENDVAVDDIEQYNYAQDVY